VSRDSLHNGLKLTNFDSNYFKKRKHLAWRAPHICEAIHGVLHPKSVQDIGCSVGDLVKGFELLGVDAWGCDKSPDLLPYAFTDHISIVDFERDSVTIRFVDLVICFETWSFIVAKNTFCHNLSLCSDQILFAADPAWHDEIQTFFPGYHRIARVETMIRLHLEPWKKKLAIKAIYNGLLYLRRAV